MFKWHFCYSWFRLQLIAIHCNRWEVCRQIHLTRNFSHAHCTRLIMCILTAWLMCLYARVIPSCHPWWAFDRPFVVRLFVFVLLLFLSVVYLFSSLSYLYSDLHSFFHVDNAKGNTQCAFAQWGVLPPGGIPSSHSLWAQRPWRLPLLRDFWNDHPGGIRRHKYGAPYLCDEELDDETIGKALSSPLFIQEREEPADRRQACHSLEESLSSGQSFFTHTRTETRTRTKFVSKTKIKSRNGKRKNQDSPWQTKRANSRWR